MENIPNKENIPIQVQFEYLNDNDILVLSKEYKINISLLEDTDFEINKEKIISNSNFKTKKERNYYHMFNKSNKKFLTKNSDFLPFIKTNSPIILINCYTYAGEIIEKMKEEFKNIKLSLDNSAAIMEIKKKEMELLLSCLENNLQIDMFADEFIYKNGIEYLVSIIKNNNGNIRKYSLEAINKLLSYQNAFDFFEKNVILLSLLYDSFIGNEEIDCAYLFFDIIVKLIGGNEDRTMEVVEKMDDNFYNKIINYLSEDNKEDNIKNHSLLFINMILNFSKIGTHLDLMFNLTKNGIFDNLDNIVKNKELIFLEQINLFESSVEKILKESDKENENYKMIKDNFDIFVENKKICHIQNLIKQTKDNSTKEQAVDELNSLLKENNYMNKFYESFMKNENIDIVNLFYDYIISFIEIKEEMELNFVNAAKYYAEKTNTKPFKQITKYFSKENKDDIKSQTLLFINKLLTFSKNENKLELLSFFVKEGILDYLFIIDITKISEVFLGQINQFNSLIQQILENSNKEDNNYQIIKSKYDIYIEHKIYNDIKNKILNIHNLPVENQTAKIDELINFIKEKEAYSILYNVFVDNKNNNLVFTFFDILVKVFGVNQDKVMLLIDIGKKYSEKNNSKLFSKIIYYSSDKNANDLIKGQALQFTNMIINFAKKDIQYELLVKIVENGIFEILHDLIKNKNASIMAQMQLFLNSVKIILKNANENDKNFKIINQKYKILEDDKKFYDKTIDDFVVIDDFNNF